MARTVISKLETESVTFGGSDYLLLSTNMKEILSTNLKEPYDKEKHKIIIETSVNKKGQRFVAFWFAKKD